MSACAAGLCVRSVYVKARRCVAFFLCTCVCPRVALVERPTREVRRCAGRGWQWRWRWRRPVAVLDRPRLKGSGRAGGGGRRPLCRPPPHPTTPTMPRSRGCRPACCRVPPSRRPGARPPAAAAMTPMETRKDQTARSLSPRPTRATRCAAAGRGGGGRGMGGGRRPAAGDGCDRPRVPIV